MGVHFEYSAEHNFMLIVFHGPVTNDEVNAHINRLLSGKYTTPGTRGLLVLCDGITSSQLSWSTIFNSGKRMLQAKFRTNGRLAIIAGNSLAYGIARIYQIATESHDDETRVLREEEMAEALCWLGMEEMMPHISSTIRQCRSTTVPQLQV